MKRLILLLCLIFTLLHSIGQPFNQARKGATKISPREIIYHVFLRSFYDSNGDGVGDLNGLRQKLDYLEELGVTSVLLLPIYQSEYYHNYFSSNFTRIDPSYGTWDDYLSLVKEIHRRHMKIYLDMETQYVTEDHPWFQKTYQDSTSGDNPYILFRDSAHTQPEPILYLNLHELPGYNGVVRKVATVNLHHKAVQEETFKIYSYWVDPDQDGHFEDGVDGFRLDHMMDDLDHKKRLTDLFTTFWKPLFSRLKKINPALVNVAEQSDGGLGFEYWQSGVDRVFAFPLQRAFLTMNKAKISAIVDTIVHTCSLQDQVVFLENHDLQRFSSAVGNRLPLLKIGAALNLLMGGVPSIYYGQELGMTGTNAMGKYGWNDGNDIPLREAFEWYRQDTGKGMALWYKDTGPWWDHSGLKPNDGISLEEERKDASSIWSFYRKLIKIRKSYPALALGRYKTLSNNNDHVYSFIRYYGADQVIVLINFSGATQKVPIGMHLSSHAKQIKKIPCLLKDGKATFDSDILAVELPAWGIQIIPIEMTVDRGQKAR